jgi:predicted ATPase/DNA-binding response OmpR family regulator/Tfp pilus assembly protein PilF
MARQQSALIVEDNRTLTLEITRVLKANNFQVAAAFGGLEGLVQFEQDQPDLLLLNLHLPGLNGFEVCRRIRQRSCVPIIMLSTLRDDTAKIAALDVGVDDYLLVPFKMDELLARVRALLRRSTWTRLLEPGAVRIGDLEIDVEGRQLLRKGRNLRLSRTEWALLELLMRHAGRVLTHRTLSQNVWGEDCGGETNVNLRVAIGRLRRKLEDDPGNPQYLMTEPGIGYYFAPLDWGDGNPLRLLSGSPVARPSALSPGNIPGPRTSFIGREIEILRLNDLLRRPDVRVVTLIGPGGSGKTRLSLQVATALQTDFEQGIVLVTLASITDPGLVKTRLALALDIKETPGQSLTDKLKVFLQDRHLLLILDNFEQVIAAADLVAELLDAAPRVKVLVTSRIRLNIGGEHVFEVPPLPLPDPDELPPPDKLTQMPAIALLIERAQAIQPDFALTAENAAAVAQICIQLDGLPLAIELAAARIKVFTPHEMLKRLSSRLSLLVGGEKDRPERHQTIRSTIDWSYNLLEESERALFAQMAVFVGGCTLEAAEAICTLPRTQSGGQSLAIIDCILSLLDKSMLQQRVEPLLESYSATRFTMLELIHEYALERLADCDTLRTVRSRHAHYYLALAEQADAELSGPQEEIRLLQLERDHYNLQAAIQWALDENENEIALRLCAALWKFWHAHGYQSEGRRWIRLVLARTAEIETPARVKTLYGSGWLHYDQGDSEQAIAAYEESLRLARTLGDQIGIAEALHGVGEMARLRGDHDLAIACYRESLDRFRELGHREGVAWSLDHLGRAMHYQGDHEHAIRLITEALAQFRALEYRRGIAIMLGNLGVIMLQQGDLAQAKNYLSESVSLHEKVGDRLGATIFQMRLAEAECYQGQLDRAATLLATCLAFSQELGYRWYSALALNQLAQVAIAQGNYTQAESHLIEALRLCLQTHNNTEGIVASLEGFAELAAARHHMTDALRFYSAAVALWQSHRLSLPPLNRLREARIIGQSHAALHDADYAVAWGDGQSMPLQALESAVQMAQSYSVTVSVTPA